MDIMEFKTIKIGKNNNKLTDSIIKDLKTSKDIGVLKCIQCGMCTSVCPASRHSEYDSREISKRVLEEDESLIYDDIIWNCFYCYTCHSVCPVGNSVSEIIQVLRQKAIINEEFEQIVTFLAFGESLLELGIGSIPIEYYSELIEVIGNDYPEFKNKLDEIREELGLGSLNLPDEDVKDIGNILEKTGFKDRLEKIRAYKKSINSEQ
ncbi:MAG TPA: 4Fe-4S dicluster domain-containing protein [Methanobacterium sp.]|jgi:heterodisulfide reductase subunit C|nr:MAG: 4Fe-4S dicluster domain-containing protein [Methanobacterium sp.]HPX77466.1 4Fe-4S dicluster domain-containing protein [Methanobacterium sp.]